MCSLTLSCWSTLSCQKSMKSTMLLCWREREREREREKRTSSKKEEAITQQTVPSTEIIPPSENGKARERGRRGREQDRRGRERGRRGWKRDYSSLPLFPHYICNSQSLALAKCMYLHFCESLQHLNQSVLKNNKQNIVNKYMYLFCTVIRTKPQNITYYVSCMENYKLY